MTRFAASSLSTRSVGTARTKSEASWLEVAWPARSCARQRANTCTKACCSDPLTFASTCETLTVSAYGRAAIGFE